MITPAVANGPQTIPVTSLVKARFGPGKLTLPVSGPLGYARFEHVQGIPSTVDGGGFSIQKLKVLDSLIERLSRMKQNARFTSEDDGASAEQIDALIQQYSRQLHHAVDQLSASGYVGEAESLGAILDGII
ncbi:MAG: hypothetical protein ACLFM6_06480 [Spirochaetaceae bacterium]